MACGKHLQETMSALSNWSFFNPVHIIGRCDFLETLAKCLPPSGSVLLVTSKGFTQRGVTAKIEASIGRKVEVYDDVQPNPELDALDQATKMLRGKGIQAVVALGGGSAIDSAKVLAATLCAPAERTLHSIFREKKHTQQWDLRLPIMAVPTTSGTGAEVTPFATVWDTVTHSKHSVSGKAMFVDHAILDPSLTLSLPASVTLQSGLDAISHSLESLWNRKSSPVSQPIAMKALALGLEALPKVLSEPGNADARAQMQEASVLAGLAISLTQTAIAHAISYPLTSVYGVPHGLACSFTLPALVDFFSPSVTDGTLKNIMTEAAHVIKRLNPAAGVMELVNLEQMLALVDKMFHPERAANFALPIHREDVIEILRKSV